MFCFELKYFIPCILNKEKLFYSNIILTFKHILYIIPYIYLYL